MIKIQSTQLKIEVAIAMMLEHQPLKTISYSVRKYLDINTKQFNHLYNNFRQGSVPYYIGGKKIELDLRNDERFMLRGFNVPAPRHELPEYTVLSNSTLTVGNYKEYTNE